MNTLFEQLQHQRGKLREALSDIEKELSALQKRIRLLLDEPVPSCSEDDRADSDPRRRE